MGTRHPFLTFRMLLSASAALGCAALVRADLAPSSPFLPANSTAAGGAQAGPAGPVELRGIMSTAQGVAYCIYDTAKKTSAWVGLNEAGNDFVVKSADPANDSVLVDFQGRSLRLVLRTAKVATAGASGGPGGRWSGASIGAVSNAPADLRGGQRVGTLPGRGGDELLPARAGGQRVGALGGPPARFNAAFTTSTGLRAYSRIATFSPRPC